MLDMQWSMVRLRHTPCVCQPDGDIHCDVPLRLLAHQASSAIEGRPSTTVTPAPRSRYGGLGWGGGLGGPGRVCGCDAVVLVSVWVLSRMTVAMHGLPWTS